MWKLSNDSWQVCIATRLMAVVLLCVWSVGCTMGTSQPGGGMPIGIVDPQRVLQETEKGQRLADTLNAFMKDRQAVVELEQKELRKLENELVAQSTVLTQSARDRKEEQFRQKMAAYQEKITELNREVQEKQRELQNEFRRHVQEVVERIAESRNLALVLERGAGSGTLYYQPVLDISNEVIESLGKGNTPPTGVR
ncbi:MAG: OmpH family outer membrane protein [Nitrospirales bacterium]|nr:OmpH family outer membrane protein [Nitrospirales bacterium]